MTDSPTFDLRPPTLVDERIACARKRDQQKARAAETRRANAVRKAGIPGTYSRGIP